jgi:hypothetical protein
MTTLSSRDDEPKKPMSRAERDHLSTQRMRNEELQPHTTYKAPVLNEEFVLRHAHLLTQQEMADMFSIGRNTLMANWGDAYNRGRSLHKVKRRKQLEDVIDQLAQTDDYNHVHKEAKTMEFKALIELWMKRYDGLGQVQAADVDSTDSGDPTEIKVVRPTREDM